MLKQAQLPHSSEFPWAQCSVLISCGPLTGIHPPLSLQSPKLLRTCYPLLVDARHTMMVMDRGVGEGCCAWLCLGNQRPSSWLKCLFSESPSPWFESEQLHEPRNTCCSYSTSACADTAVWSVMGDTSGSSFKKKIIIQLVVLSAKSSHWQNHCTVPTLCLSRSAHSFSLMLSCS